MSLPVLTPATTAAVATFTADEWYRRWREEDRGAHPKALHAAVRDDVRALVLRMLAGDTTPPVAIAGRTFTAACSDRLLTIVTHLALPDEVVAAAVAAATEVRDAVMSGGTDPASQRRWHAAAHERGEPLAGKRVLVTGAASGIGHAIVRDLLDHTAALIVAVDIDEDRLGEWAKDPQAWRILTVHCDLADTTALDALPTDIDVLVNNAGRLIPGPLHDYDMDLAERTLQVMLYAPMRLAAHVLPWMRAQDWGVIINMGSVYSLIGGDAKGAYLIAKHGLLGLTRQIALENARHGIRSILVCPAHVDSPLLAGQIIDEAAADDVDPAVRETQLRDQLATGRFVEPTEIAANVLWLLGDEARSITGVPYIVDGGWTAGTRSHAAPPALVGA